MDVNLITTSAIETVGIIQILKNFLPEKFPKWLYAIFMCVLAPLFCLIGQYCPQIVTTSILTICVSQLGYETILQTIKKLISKGSE